MKYKKYIVAFVIFASIIFYMQYKRIDVFDIVDKGCDVPTNVKVLFFNDFAESKGSCSVLCPEEAVSLLSKIKKENFRTHDYTLHHGSRFYGIEGEFCVIPKWFDIWPLNVLAPCLRASVYVKYDPWKRLLYLSEDCYELGLEFTEGFCVSNVSPDTVKVDMSRMALKHERIKVEHAIREAKLKEHEPKSE